LIDCLQIQPRPQFHLELLLQNILIDLLGGGASGSSLDILQILFPFRVRGTKDF